MATAYSLPVVMRLKCLLCGLKGFSFLPDSSLYSRGLQLELCTFHKGWKSSHTAALTFSVSDVSCQALTPTVGPEIPGKPSKISVKKEQGQESCATSFEL